MFGANDVWGITEKPLSSSEGRVYETSSCEVAVVWFISLIELADRRIIDLDVRVEKNIA